MRRPRRRSARAARARRSRGRRRSCARRRACPWNDDAAVVEHDDLVGERDRREAVGDDDRRPAAHRLAQAVADLRLGRRVDRRGRVVEDQDARVDDERARDRDALALAAGERDPALADHRVVAVRQRLDELVRLREARRALDLLVGRVGASERDVLAHRRREEERVLRDHADRAPQRGELHVADVGAVDRDAARAARRRSAGRATRASSCRRRCGRSARRPGPRSSSRSTSCEHRPLRVVAERDAVEDDAAVARRQLARAGRVARCPRARRSPGRCARPTRSRAAPGRSTCRARAAA